MEIKSCEWRESRRHARDIRRDTKPANLLRRDHFLEHFIVTLTQNPDVG